MYWFSPSEGIITYLFTILHIERIVVKMSVVGFCYRSSLLFVNTLNGLETRIRSTCSACAHGAQCEQCPSIINFQGDSNSYEIGIGSLSPGAICKMNLIETVCDNVNEVLFQPLNGVSRMVPDLTVKKNFPWVDSLWNAAIFGL